MPIIVNKVEITDDEVHSEMQYHPAPTLEEARHSAAHALVIRQLLLLAAQKKKLFNSQEKLSIKKEEEMIDMLLKQEIFIPEADKETCEHYYQQNQERFIDLSTGKLLPFKNVIVHIRNYLQTRSFQTGISQYIKVLTEEAKITGFEIDKITPPPVQ